MPVADFVHLRVHSAYSLLQGAIQISGLAALCREHGMPAVAVTDTNNLFGAMEFSSAAAEAGVQPIIGCQLSFGAEGEGKLAVLVQNEAGYLNLLHLLAAAYLDGECAQRVSVDGLAAHADGLILLTGGAEGPLGRLMNEGRKDAAVALAGRLAAAFPGRLYVEIMRHGLEAEARVEPALLDLAYGLELPIVATNDCHFADASMFEAHDALICIAEGALVSETDRRRLNPEHRFKSAEEMRALFEDLPEAVDNTIVIARRCAFMVEARDPILPPFDCGPDRSEEDELRAQARAGLDKRLAERGSMDGHEHSAKAYRKRLDYELDVIMNMGFSGYFLIVADFIRWAKEQGIPVGPGRGSGAGSVVAWALTITDLDPLRFGLLFERFLNPERVSMADFDIDFCQDRRDEVIAYVQQKYGRDRVAQIITFGKLQARAVLRDVGRVLEMPYSQVDRICKLVPNNPADPVTLDQAIAREPLLGEMIENDESVSRLVGIARKLEGLYRHASTHAAGVVIGDRPLRDLIPLYSDPRSDTPVTGFNMKSVERAGLVKFDFLGLKTLTVLARAVEFVNQGRDADKVDLANLPLDDEATFRMIGQGETTGVFQLESSGMRDVLRNLKPDTFEDIIAVVALYRPGPMGNIPSYIRRKHGKEKPDYPYPNLEGILKETFGIMIYQEQVMQIAQELSGYTLGGADILRRAMGKKIKKEMNQQRQTFVDGAVARGVPEAKASDIFDQVAKFAGYGFNKSHAAAYALVAYQTAYMKANHPVEFMAASMALDQGDTDKLNLFKDELKRLGVPLLPPDVNASEASFTVEGDGIRYALAAIKNVGAAAMETLVSERRRAGPFKDLTDLARRLDSRALNKRQLENLVRAGALDALNPNRRQVYEAIDIIMGTASAAARERDSGQIALFGGDDGADLRIPKTTDWAKMERLTHEFEAIGFYLTGHPLDSYAKSLKRIQARTSADVVGEGRSGPVSMAGTVMAKKERTSSRGNRYAFVQFSDTAGNFEVTVFSEVLAAARDILEVGNSLYIKASVQFEGESVRFTAHALEPLDLVASRAGAGLRVIVEEASSLPLLREVLDRVGGANNGGNGKGRVLVVSRIDGGQEVEVRLSERYLISPLVLHAVEDIPGIAGVEEI
ncbi:MAG: DNA polymerase III subunit alpha [Proteobacteria bacterium]|nr:DNA polymerase III subunit alpha [Pseudomonadota bacterium]